MLTTKNLTVKIGRKEILKDFSFAFKKGKIYAVMGPNGSGKSTLAHTIMGSPVFKVAGKSTLTYQKQNIKNWAPEKRATAGIFLSFQSPLALSGVSVMQLLRLATRNDEQKISARELKEKVEKIAAELKIPEELLRRSLNDGFSGGERKKMEVLQAAVLNPDLIVLDEVDTGVDVDALKTIAQFLKKFHTPDKTYIIITHYNRILKYLTPDEVIVIRDGHLIKKGDKKLAQKIEKDGYNNI